MQLSLFFCLSLSLFCLLFITSHLFYDLNKQEWSENFDLKNWKIIEKDVKKTS